MEASATPSRRLFQPAYAPQPLPLLSDLLTLQERPESFQLLLGQTIVTFVHYPQSHQQRLQDVEEKCWYCSSPFQSRHSARTNSPLLHDPYVRSPLVCVEGSPGLFLGGYAALAVC